MLKSRIDHLKKIFFASPSLSIVYAFLAFVSVFYVLVIANIPTQNGDNIEHVHSSFLIAIGQVPYKDFFQHHNPLMWYLFAPVVGFFAYNSIIIEIVCLISFFVFLKSLVYVYKICEEFFCNKLWAVIACALITIPGYKLYAVDFRPDNYMLFCLIAGIYYYFMYLRYKKQKQLSISFVWFFVSFMFAQKCLPALFVLGVISLWKLRKREICFSHLCKALIFPLGGFFIFLFYLYHYEMIELYYVSNYTFNFNLVSGFDFFRFAEIPLYMKIILSLSFVGVLASLFSKNQYWKIFSLLFVAEFIQRIWYFSPYSYYYWMMFYFAVFCLVPFFCVIDERYKYIRLFFIAMMYYFLYKSVVFYSSQFLGNKSRYLPSYITQNINPCDYVFNGDGMMYNLFGKDPAYYWQLIGQLDIVGEASGIYPKPNINELILKYKPKFVYGSSYLNRFADETGRKQVIHYVSKDIIAMYYKSTGFPSIYELKPEYDKRICLKDEKTGKWTYKD